MRVGGETEPGERTATVAEIRTPRRGQRSPTKAVAYPRFEPPFPLVEAKLHPPARRPGAVPRDRLVRLLTAEPRPRVVSIIAPPGYG